MDHQVVEARLSDPSISRARATARNCAWCNKHIDAERLLDLRFDGESCYVSPCRPEQIEERCPSCELLNSITPSDWNVSDQKLTLYKEPSDPCLDRTYQRYFGVCKYFFTSDTDTIGYLLPISNASNHECPVHIVDRIAIHYGYLANWLDACATNHNHICIQAKKPKSPLQLYALDCLTKAIVPLRPDDKYVALSYVWGEAADLAQSPLLPSGDAPVSTLPLSEFPLTIKDSIEITRNTGYRYLWVDRYCIPQVDVSQRHEAIANMDQVYARAAFTIIALDGANVHAGLHGVSTRPRTCIQQVAVPNGHLRSTLPILSTLIDESIWSTRAWTFQELRLSRRCLFFTQCQVYFSCSEVTLSEALPEVAPPKSWLANCFRSGHSDPISRYMFKETLAGFFGDRLRYTSKTLSYQKDILDAFRGIIGLHEYVTLWGNPIARVGWPLDPCVSFAMGLLWEPTRLCRRRPGFPTWSWTSVVGQVSQRRIADPHYLDFLESGSGPPNSRMDRVKPVFSVQIPNLGETLAQTIENSRTKILPELSTSIIVEGDVFRLVKDPFYGFWRFCDWNGKRHPYQPEPFPQPDVPGRGGGQAATAKALEGVQDGLVIVNWNVDQSETEVRFVLMLLRWVGDNIAERVGLLGHYEDRVSKTFVGSLSRRHLKFELR